MSSYFRVKYALSAIFAIYHAVYLVYAFSTHDDKSSRKRTHLEPVNPVFERYLHVPTDIVISVNNGTSLLGNLLHTT